MENLVKDAVRVGNSAGVLLPKEWLGGKVEVSLVERPMDIRQEIFRILEPILDDVIGIYLTGSYARNEQEPDSDIDVLVATGNTNAVKSKGRFHIIVLSLGRIKEELKKNIITILPLIREAKALLNKQLLEELKKAKATKQGLRWHIDTSKSALRIVKGLLDLETGEVIGSKAIIYSLILRLREVYIADCLLKNKNYSTRQFRELLDKILDKGIVKELMLAYKAERDKKRGVKCRIRKESIEKLYDLVEDMLHKQEKEA